MKKNIIISLILILLTALTIIVTCYMKKEKTVDEDDSSTGIKASSNINNGVIEDKKLENFSFTNTSLVYQEGTSILETTVTNNSDNIEYLQEFKIVLYDENDTELITLTGFIGDSINAHESKMIQSACGIDLSNAIRIEYSVIR